MDSPTTSSAVGVQTFYAVCIPPQPPTCSGDDVIVVDGRVFSNLKEAQEFARQNKQQGARFKAFTSSAAAEGFLNGEKVQGTPRRGEGDTQGNRRNGEEPVIPYPSLTLPQLSHFRRAVESGNRNQIADLVEENPRYLVDVNGDHPTVIHAGSHQNALHFAAQKGHIEVCKLILSSIDDISLRLLKKLYPGDICQIQELRRQLLLEGYLNTPDKGNNDTPLHLASKFGQTEVVQLLTSFRECRQDVLNKHGESALQLACSRSGDKSAKKRIETILQEYYVPLYRPDDFSGGAHLVPPLATYPTESVSPRNAQSDIPTSPLVVAQLRLAAVAGPFSTADDANAFYEQWNDAKYCRDCKRTDLHKGFERVGRRLAFERSVGWTEWWPFLGVSADLTTDDGLTLLNNALRDDHFSMELEFGRTTNKIDSPWFGKVCSRFPQGVNELCNTLDSVKSRLTFDNDTESEIVEAPLIVVQSPENDIDDDDMFYDSLSELEIPDLPTDGDCSVKSESDNQSPSPLKKGEITLLCDDLHEFHVTTPVNAKTTAAEDSQTSETRSKARSKKKFPRKDSSESPPKRNRTEESTPEPMEPPSEEFRTPSDTPPPMRYLTGDAPTKVDFDVFTAVTVADDGVRSIDSRRYPALRRWLETIKLYSKQERTDWPCLESPRIRKTATRTHRFQQW